MWVHLLRHGIAIDPTDPACPTDPERFLTDKGKARVRLAARGLRALGIAPEVVISSPYVRAQQTAEIAREELGDIELVTSDLLVPMAEPSRIVDVLRARSEQNILCVGHLPNLDLVTAYLVGADDPITSLKKAGCASIEIRNGRPGAGTGLLVGVYPASALRRLGGGDD
ncbi:MAG: phosphohistidine phosphatase SixA [Myxococcales bacterium]|nr:phosphohistidine phosphatase SixA [Myxococcales bacterium]